MHIITTPMIIIHIIIQIITATMVTIHIILTDIRTITTATHITPTRIPTISTTKKYNTKSHLGSYNHNIVKILTAVRDRKNALILHCIFVKMVTGYLTVMCSAARQAIVNQSSWVIFAISQNPAQTISAQPVISSSAQSRARTKTASAIMAQGIAQPAGA